MDARPRTDDHDLSGRVPGEAVITELLRIQSGVRPRSRTARFFGRSPLCADAEPWYAGAVGERRVGRLLETLDDRWTVIHSVPVGAGSTDIDHLAIGPGGVITINTKHHADKSVWVADSRFLVSGQHQPYIRNSEYEAKRVTMALGDALPLGFEVVPLLAIVGSASLKVKKAPTVVKVIDAEDLGRWIRRRPRLLDQSQVEHLTRVALRAATWLSRPAATAQEAPSTRRDSAEVVAEFAALDRAVRRARLRRVGWVLFATASFVALMLVAGPVLVRFIADSLLAG